MDYSEKDIENFLINSKILEEEYGITVLCQQYRTEFGVIDLLGHDGGEQLVVIELKKGVVDENAVGQIMRYIACMKELVNHLKNSESMPDGMNVVNNIFGLLIGTSSTDGVKLIARQFDFIKLAKCEVELSMSIDDEEYNRNVDSLKNDCREADKILLNRLHDIHIEQVNLERWQEEHYPKKQQGDY